VFNTTFLFFNQFCLWFPTSGRICKQHSCNVLVRTQLGQLLEMCTHTHTESNPLGKDCIGAQPLTSPFLNCSFSPFHTHTLKTQFCCPATTKKSSLSPCVRPHHTNVVTLKPADMHHHTAKERENASSRLSL